jgi:hypothetical protein
MNMVERHQIGDFAQFRVPRDRDATPWRERIVVEALRAVVERR